MGKPAKKKAGREKQTKNSSEGSSSASRDATDRSAPKSIPRLDGNRDPNVPPVEYMDSRSVLNLSDGFGMGGFYALRNITPPEGHVFRPQPNSFGRECGITLNTFNVIRYPQGTIYQYDLHFSGDATDYSKRVVLKKIWNSKAVQEALGQPNQRWIWDGNKLAWSKTLLARADSETRIEVDLDAENGRRPGGKSNKHILTLRKTRDIDFTRDLKAFLESDAEWTTGSIDTINFLDHLMREWPSQQYTQIKKSFFQRGEKRVDLGGGIEAFKGVFASLRPVINDVLGKSLAVNVDVANGTFWRAQELGRAIGQVFRCEPTHFSTMFKAARRNWDESLLKQDLRRFKRVGVTATHTTPHTQWTIAEIMPIDANQAKFPDPENESRQISVAQYFQKKYNIRVMSEMPVVKMTKKIRGGDVYMPIEVLKIDANQRYNTKLSDKQTSEMIKFAVTLPKERWAAVQHGLRLLNWPEDPFLRHYGLGISTNPSKVKARVLPVPTVSFQQGSGTISPNDLVKGRWQITGRKFAKTQPSRPIMAWGVCVIQDKDTRGPPPEAVDKFISQFIEIYEGHGGTIARHPTYGKKPWYGPGNVSDGGELVAKAWNATGKKYNTTPSFMVFIMPSRNIELYRRIKKSMDLRFGAPSQCLQGAAVMKNQAQYISNVCMKVNAKFGGATTVVKSQVIPRSQPNPPLTMVIGADVSHPAPGSGSADAASFAAITVSSDLTHTTYWAGVDTNGHRTEMISSANINQHFGFMAKNWMARFNGNKPPPRVLYIRDGVSEGQYASVLDNEVQDMKDCFRSLGATTVPKFTVVIAGKRHHVRFFPETGKGDRNSNPLPGTLVESGCCHPFEFDFYLCSHVAIKGTARPIHYHVILNEGDQFKAAELQSFIFEHSFQYVRSTTPVSLHPAVYYAHLAADRARAHTYASPVNVPKKEAKDQEKKASTRSSEMEVLPLMPMPNVRGLKETMWYI